VESIGVQSIDELNILQATLLGMRLAVERLDPVPDLALIDGNQSPEHRDRLMCEIHEEFPAYGFNTHKGYPTPRHLEILQRIGPCPHHRRSYAPVRAALSGHPGPG
jgi:ribonuclease HII